MIQTLKVPLFTFHLNNYRSRTGSLMLLVIQGYQMLSSLMEVMVFLPAVSTNSKASVQVYLPINGSKN